MQIKNRAVLAVLEIMILNLRSLDIWIASRNAGGRMGAGAPQ
jgi:hypothetical protein